jgi:hypothetical protein
MARTRVADFERDLNEAPGGFADELLCTDNTLWQYERQAAFSLLQNHFFRLLIVSPTQERRLPQLIVGG